MTIADQYVLDSSVTLAWFFEDEITPFTAELEERLPDATVFVAVIWPLEVANVLTTAERKGRTTQTRVEQFVRRLKKQPISVDTVGLDGSFTTLWKLAKRHTLTVYDAAYLELAIRLELPLATLDQPLRRAAELEDVQVLRA